MTVARSAGDVLSDHTVFEVECIDRMFLNVWVPRLAYGAGVQGFFVGHRGHHYASTALMDPMTKAFVADIHGFVAARGLELVSFGKERKDDVAQQFLARFTGTEGVLFVGRAQEKALVWRTQRRYNQAGEPTRGWCVPRRSSTTSTSIAWMRISARSSSSSAPTSPTPASCASTATSGPNARPPRPGSGSTALDNGFAAVDDVAAVQAICDSLGTGADRRAAAQVAGDPAQPVHRRRRGRRLPLRAVDPAGGVLADPDARPRRCPGGSSSSRSSTTTSTSAAPTRSG